MSVECPIRSTMDGYACARCGTRWDRDDDAPPCPRTIATRGHDENHERANRYLAAIRRVCPSNC